MNNSKKKIIRIAITGPESTGKSTLAKQLSEHYQTLWVPEYARQYLDQLNRDYRKEDLMKIAKGQVASEEKLAIKANRYLFCDTEMTVLKIWSEFKYGNVDPFILDEYNSRKYDMYLLMDIDLPWEYDPQREHPEKRRFFFDWFERELKGKKASYKIISGYPNQRLETACTMLDRL